MLHNSSSARYRKQIETSRIGNKVGVLCRPKECFTTSIAWMIMSLIVPNFWATLHFRSVLTGFIYVNLNFKEMILINL